MRAKVLICGLVVGVLCATVSRAQVYPFPTPAPQVTAATAMWQIQGEPLFYAGDFYYPTGPTVFFDGSIMMRTGTYEGIPLYADTTIEPYTIVYVPIGRNVMRPYARRSKAPAGQAGVEPDVIPEAAARPVGTTGSLPRPSISSSAPVRKTIPATRSLSAVWIDFENARWSLAGSAVPYDPGTFVRIGDRRGWPVYRAKGESSMIFVPAVDGGLLTPYRRD